MAMAIFRNLVQSEGEAWQVDSAGTWAIEGVPVTPKALQVLKDHELDISDHRSQPINQELIEAFDLILTMEKNHKEALMIEFPRKAGKIYMLSEIIGLTYDIPDPIGKSLLDFQNAYNEIEQILKSGLKMIRRLVMH